MIKIEDVLKAYEETGLKPIRGSFFENNFTCACALSSLYAYKKNKDNPAEALRYLKELNESKKFDEELKSIIGLPDDFDIIKFYVGFDGLIYGTQSEEYKLGQQIRVQLEEELGEIPSWDSVMEYDNEDE